MFVPTKDIADTNQLLVTHFGIDSDSLAEVTSAVKVLEFVGQFETQNAKLRAALS